MYPTLFHLFKDLFGVDWNFLKPINSFGFFVAIAFLGSCMFYSEKRLSVKKKKVYFMAT